MSGDEKAASTGVLQTGEPADFFRQPLAMTPEEVEAEPKKFGAGRPKGSRNRTSDDIARLVQQIGGHPVLAMARIQAMTIAEIKEMLGCTRIDAFDRWWKVVCELAPYVASKQPLAIAVNSKVVALNFTVPTPGGQQLPAGPDAVAQMFAQGLERAAEEGFALPALAAPEETESDDETTT